MSQLKQLILFSKYNLLMNQRLYSAASRLSSDQLTKDQGAFFKSVLGTLNHIMLGDIIWLKRFAEHPSSTKALSYILALDKPESLDSILFTDFTQLKKERESIDKAIDDWVVSLSEHHLDECLVFKTMAGKQFSKPFGSLVSHLFNHQTHHRGQVTTLLSQYGIDCGATDLVEIIDECSESLSLRQ